MTEKRPKTTSRNAHLSIRQAGGDEGDRVLVVYPVIAMQTLSIPRIEAHISRFGRIQQSNYPPYARVQSVLFTWTHQGQAQEVWKTYPADEARLLKVGQRAFLSSRTGRNHQVIWEVEIITPGATQGYPPQTQDPSQAQAQAPTQSYGQPPPAVIPGQNSDISAWVQAQAELYGQCFDAAWRVLATREVSEETVRAAASSLFINACRKFNLEH